ncbi:hypothetical protein [Arthrobacter sp. Marseille-P9274]|uniref:hypothetical protein n=1 Tax=Arthrobacter sp. Marseille-P9274 TaxID=2866572 RepID=UPI0021C61DE1|nr:hypothetical protein [Arthrobacter sp. Marseille-P9274]
MATGEGVCRQIVSIQRPGAVDAEAGHVTWGVLISETMVVCRDVGWVEDADRWWDVLVAAPSRDGTGTVEHIRMREIDVLGNPNGPGAVALVKLAHAPVHEVHTDVVVDDFDEAEFYRALGVEGNVCAALEAVRVLPAQRPEGTVSQVLGPVDRWKLDGRGLRVRSFDPRAPLADAGGAESQLAGAGRPVATEGEVTGAQAPGAGEGDGAAGEGSGEDTETRPRPPDPDRILLCFFKRCR